MVKYLIYSRHVDVNQCNDIGWSALHHACVNGHTAVCDVLIRAGANVKTRNKFGASPLNVAVASGHLSTVK